MIYIISIVSGVYVAGKQARVPPPRHLGRMLSLRGWYLIQKCRWQSRRKIALIGSCQWMDIVLLLSSFVQGDCIRLFYVWMTWTDCLSSYLSNCAYQDEIQQSCFPSKVELYFQSGVPYFVCRSLSLVSFHCTSQSMFGA
jgi:hypothetical protein